MTKKKNPLLSDEFLDELALEINELYGFPDKEQSSKKDSSEKDSQAPNNIQK